MALTKLEKDMNIVQALDDEPNDVGGLAAAALKAKFDEGGAAVKEYLNDTLTPELDTALDGKTPTTRTVSGHPLSADVTVTKADVGLGNVDNTSDADKPVSTAQQAALDLKANRADVLEKSNTASFTPSADYHPATKKYVDDTTAAVVMGILPDKSVTSDKLADGAVTVEKMASQFYANASHTHPASDLSTVVPVTSGGTGAADAAGARANLGAAAVSHTHTQSEITGLLAALAGNAEVVIGSYTGDGAKERSLTFPSPPKLLFVSFQSDYGTYSGGMFLVCNSGGFSFGGSGASISGGAVGGYAVVSKVVENTVTWKNDASASYLQNQSGTLYAYAAIL